MENDQYYVFNPNDSSSARPKIKKDRHLIFGFVFVGIAMLLIVGLVATAYFVKIWPFSETNPTILLSKAIEKISTIESVAYDFSINPKSVAKSTDSKPFVFSDADYEALVSIYGRDNVRLANARDIISQLKEYKLTRKKYPKLLSEAGISLQDPSGQPYQYSSNGKTFSLIITFETNEAMSKLPSSIVKNGKMATFNEKSSISILTITPEKPFLISNYDELIGLIEKLPSNFSFTGGASGNLDKNSAATLKFLANVNYKDVILNIDIESLLKDNEAYFKFNAFPALPLIDLSNIKEKWIKIGKEDLGEVSSYWFIPVKLSDKQEEIGSLSEQLKIISSIIKKEGIIQLVGEPTKELIDKEKAYHYQFKIVMDKLPSFYTNVANELSAKFQDNAIIKFDQEIFNSLSLQSTLSLLNYVNQHYSIDVYISTATGYPVKALFSWTLIPSEAADNITVLSMSLNLKNINKKINIVVPAESMSVQDAYLTIIGMKKEDYLLQQQERNITNIRANLFYFRDLAGRYPDSLEQLMMTNGEVKKLNTDNATSSLSVSLDDIKLMDTIPQDVFTKQSFGYEKTSDGNYKLTYQMVIPAYKQGTKPSSLLYQNDYPGLICVSGLNTSTITEISLEAKAQNSIDSDEDGLSDIFEAYLGTNPKEKDTDKDGYSDGEELKMDYDPLTTGMLQ